MSRSTSNWIDRGDPVDVPLRRLLGGALGVIASDPRLEEPVQVLCGQVAASANEGEVAAYVTSLLPAFSRSAPDRETLRILAAALWHVAKIGLMREVYRGACPADVE